MIKIPNDEETIEGYPYDQGDDEFLEKAPSPEENKKEKVVKPQLEEQEEKELFEEQPTIEKPEVSLAAPKEVEERIQEIAEIIIDEKWAELTNKLGNLAIWKDRVATEITAIKQEIFRIQNRFENLQNAMVGKLSEYNRNIVTINSEMKALENVLKKILEPLTSNIKELSKITKDLKSKKVK